MQPVPVIQVSWNHPLDSITPKVEEQDTCVSVGNLLAAAPWLRDSIDAAINQAERMNARRIYPDNYTDTAFDDETAYGYLYRQATFKLLDEVTHIYLKVRHEGWEEMHGGKVSLSATSVRERGHLFPSVTADVVWHRDLDSYCALNSVANAAQLLDVPLSASEYDTLRSKVHRLSSIQVIQHLVNHTPHRRIQLSLYTSGYTSVLSLNAGVFVLECDSHCVSIDVHKRTLIDTSENRSGELGLSVVSLLDSFPAMSHWTIGRPQFTIYKVERAAEAHTKHRHQKRLGRDVNNR